MPEPTLVSAVDLELLTSLIYPRSHVKPHRSPRHVTVLTPTPFQRLEHHHSVLIDIAGMNAWSHAA